MRLLSFDASDDLSIFLEEGRILQAKVYSSEGNRQMVAAQLLPAIDSALSEAGWDKDSLDLLVVGVGPGSFTGIRTAIVTARTVAQALKLPLIGISQFDCLSYVLKDKLPAAIVLSAGTSRTVMHYFAGAYHKEKDGRTTVDVEPSYLSEEELLGQMNHCPLWFIGQSCQLLENKNVTQPLPAVENMATIQARIALDRVSLKLANAHQTSDAQSNHRQFLADEFPWASVMPLYLRGPSITLKPAVEAPLS